MSEPLDRPRAKQSSYFALPCASRLKNRYIRSTRTPRVREAFASNRAAGERPLEG
jgi:hypothetical protein